MILDTAGEIVSRSESLPGSRTFQVLTFKLCEPLSLVTSSLSISHNQILGAILCGGKSTRFGSAKAFHEFEGITLVERALRVISPIVEKVYLAIGDSDTSQWPNAKLLRDRVPGIGPIGGIHAALQEMTHEWLLALPVDVPYMTSEALNSLVIEARDGDKAVVAVDSGGRLHPLCALYHRSIQSEIDLAIARKEYSPTYLLSGMKNVRYVTFPNESLRNVNRPEDLP